MVPFSSAKLLVANAATVFDEQGALKDTTVRAQLEAYLAAFVRFVERQRA